MLTLLMMESDKINRIRGISNSLENFLFENVPTFNTLLCKNSVNDIIDNAVFMYALESRDIFNYTAIKILELLELELRSKNCISVDHSDGDYYILYDRIYDLLKYDIINALNETLVIS